MILISSGTKPTLETAGKGARAYEISVRSSVKKVTASRNRGESSLITEEAVDADVLKAATETTGYSSLSMESAPCENNGLFGWK